VPGYEAPVNLAYSNRNRSASLRIPVTSNEKAKRIEYRTPDASANGYLAFAAMMMAGLDGIENKIDPGQPLDKDIYGLSPEELKDIPNVATSLEDALNNLEADHAFLLKGDVFTEDVIDMWISYKRAQRLIRCVCVRYPKNSLCTSIADFLQERKEPQKSPRQAGAFLWQTVFADQAAIMSSLLLTTWTSRCGKGMLMPSASKRTLIVSWR
jgi:hypothetical protein